MALQPVTVPAGMLDQPFLYSNPAKMEFQCCRQHCSGQDLTMRSSNLAVQASLES